MSSLYINAITSIKSSESLAIESLIHALHGKSTPEAFVEARRKAHEVFQHYLPILGSTLFVGQGEYRLFNPSTQYPGMSLPIGKLLESFGIHKPVEVIGPEDFLSLSSSVSRGLKRKEGPFDEAACDDAKGNSPILPVSNQMCCSQMEEVFKNHKQWLADSEGSLQRLKDRVDALHKDLNREMELEKQKRLESVKPSLVGEPVFREPKALEESFSQCFKLLTGDFSTNDKTRRNFMNIVQPIAKHGPLKVEEQERLLDYFSQKIEKSSDPISDRNKWLVAFVFFCLSTKFVLQGNGRRYIQEVLRIMAPLEHQEFKQSGLDIQDLSKKMSDDFKAIYTFISKTMAKALSSIDGLRNGVVTIEKLSLIKTELSSCFQREIAPIISRKDYPNLPLTFENWVRLGIDLKPTGTVDFIKIGRLLLEGVNIETIRTILAS